MRPDDAQNVKNNKSKGLPTTTAAAAAAALAGVRERKRERVRRATHIVGQSNGSFATHSAQLSAQLRRRHEGNKQ